MIQLFTTRAIQGQRYAFRHIVPFSLRCTHTVCVNITPPITINVPHPSRPCSPPFPSHTQAIAVSFLEKLKEFFEQNGKVIEEGWRVSIKHRSTGSSKGTQDAVSYTFKKLVKNMCIKIFRFPFPSFLLPPTDLLYIPSTSPNPYPHPVVLLFPIWQEIPFPCRNLQRLRSQR